MKKTLLSLMGGMLMCMSASAQDVVDVTHLITNAGFDEDLTFQADGTMKEAISTTTSLSGRSWAYIAADSTVYARPTSTSSQSRPDGRKMEAVNGFKGRIMGWTLESNSEFPKCEWTYFGSVSYDLGEETIPIADDGSTYLVVPERPTEFDGGAGFVYLRAGWTNSAIYKQVVKLPCAQYRLEYWTININPNTTAVAKDLTQIVCRKDVFKDEEGTGLSAQEWTLHSFEFTPTSEFTMQFGYEAANAGSGGQPIVGLDGIKLYKIGEADERDILMTDINDWADRFNGELVDLCYSDNGDEYAGLINEAESLSDELYPSSDDIEVLNASIASYEAAFARIQEAIAAANEMSKQLARAEMLSTYTDYPGLQDFTAKIDEIRGMLYGEDGTSQAILEAKNAVTEAINAYYMTQSASMEDPANYSFFIQHPWFCAEERQPADNTIDAITEAALTNDDRNDTGWVNGSQTSGGVIQQFYTIGRTCYQLWNAGSFTGYLDVHQELTGLPNGIYSIQADMVTNNDALGDQHIYANSSLGSTEGYMSAAGMLIDWASGTYSGDIVDWETVTTTATVIVVDGKLTIGARSTSAGEGEDVSDGQRRGCFWVSNFVLRYHGEADPDQIAAAAAARLKVAQDLAAAMHFAGDKQIVNDSIALYQSNSNLDALNAGIALAEKSEAKYEEIMAEGKSIPTIAAALEENADANYGAAVDIVRVAYNSTIAWLNSNTAKYAEADSCIQLMKNYTTTYAEAYNAANEVLAGLNSAVAKGELKTIMDNQKARLIASENKLLSAEIINEMVASLANVEAVAQAQDLYEADPDATDFTGFIKNPDFAAITGWDVTKVKGDGPIKSGQYYKYSEETTHNYFDSYNSEALDIHAEQVIANIPNGTYTARVAARTSGAGSFIFAANGGAEKADTMWVEIPVNTYTYFDGETGEEVVANASDINGPMWQEAAAIMDAGFDEAANDLYLTNSGNGRGWMWLTIENIVVNNHTIVLGMSTNAARTGKQFEGKWFSIVDWSLELTEKGDNSGWNGPITAVNDVTSSTTTAADGMYDIQGRRVNAAVRGLYIRVVNGKAQKVLVR